MVAMLAGALMVSRFAYWSFKGVSPRGRISFAYVLIIPLIFVLIAIDPPRVCFLLACTYASSGMVIAVWRRWRRQSGRSPFGQRPDRCSAHLSGLDFLSAIPSPSSA